MTKYFCNFNRLLY